MLLNSWKRSLQNFFFRHKFIRRSAKRRRSGKSRTVPFQMMISSLGFSYSPQRSRRPRLAARIERLEGKALLSGLGGAGAGSPAIVVVTNTNDSGSGSLRQAIIDANSSLITNTIDFNISGTGVHTISPISALPHVTDAVVIDGTSQPGYSGTPLIQIDGSKIGMDGAGNIAPGQFPVDGLVFDAAADNSTVRGMMIENLSGNGVVLQSNDTLTANVIGTSAYVGPYGAVDYYRAEVGAKDSIGTNDGTFGNNAHTNVTGEVGSAFQFNAANNDYIDLGGTNLPGSMTISTWVNFSQLTPGQYLLGDIDSGGNASQGALTQSVDPTGQHFRLGWHQTTNLGNAAGTGYDPYGPNDGRILTAQTTTELQLNTWYHIVVVRNDDAKSVTMYVNGAFEAQSNYLGTVVSLQSHEYLGTVSPAFPWVAFDGKLDEVGYFDRALTQSEIQSMYQQDSVGDGLGQTGEFIGGGNGMNGVNILGDGDIIGTNGDGVNDANEGNVLSGNFQDGLVTIGDDTVIAGNLIGVDLTGAKPLGNRSNGVSARFGAKRTRLGTNSDGVSDNLERNVISASKVFAGVIVADPGTDDTVIAGNLIGTNAAGDAALPNHYYGIFVFTGPQGTIIGGDVDAARNVISGNNNTGINVSDGATGGTVIKGNYIGTNAAGIAALPNNGEGIDVNNGAQGTVIGGSSIGARNVISGNNFQGIIIGDIGTDGTVVQGNYIGIDAAGTDPLANGDNGILVVNGAKSTIIGGSSPDVRNVISGNGGSGIQISDPGTDGTVVQGNYIGTNATGTDALANVGSGVFVFSGAKSTVIGGSSPDEGNVISGNVQSGILISDPGTDGTNIKGNYIGTNAAGTLAVPNQFFGISIQSGAQGTIIRGDSFDDRNVISGNGVVEINVSNAGTDGTVIQGNFIGTNVAGTDAIPNQSTGINLSDGAQRTIIGGDSILDRNVISGNYFSGIAVTDQGTDGTVIAGNFIGINADGTAALANLYGVLVVNSANSTIIGGPHPGDRNVISGNSIDGIYVSDFGTDGTEIRGNFIGTNAAGTLAVPNASTGIRIRAGAQETIVGGDTQGDGNVISGNMYVGIYISDFGTDGTVIAGNVIGLNAGGTYSLGNQSKGIEVEGSIHNMRIGGVTAASRNVISGDGYAGIYIQDFVPPPPYPDGPPLDDGASNNVIEGNYIGTDATGTYAIGSSMGVYLGEFAFSNTIGGSVPGAGNTISGNTTTGIVITGARNTGNRILGNNIGTDATGSFSVGTQNFGVALVDGAAMNVVGGTTDDERNTISGNQVAGIVLQGAGVTQNLVQGNYIGVDRTGRVKLPNVGYGIGIDAGATQNTIGGLTSLPGTGLGNLISGNGIQIYLNETGNLVEGNSLGLGSDGTTAIDSSTIGLLASNLVGLTIGGSNLRAGNVFAGMQKLLALNSDTNTTIESNRFGTTADGNAAVTGAEGLVINLGSNIDIERNQFSDPTSITATDHATLKGNTFGLSADGSNTLVGSVGSVTLTDTSTATVGGFDQNSRNVFSGQSGVTVEGSDTGNARVLGNYFGTDVDGRVALPSLVVGIAIRDGAEGTLIEGNVVGAASEAGIKLDHSNSTTVDGNLIGLLADGTTAGLIEGNGLVISNSGFNGVGLVSEGESPNYFASAALSAILLDGPRTQSNAIDLNFIGLDRNGQNWHGNRYGVSFQNGAGNNELSGNELGDNQIGVYIQSTAGSNNQLYGNSIGINGLGNGIGLRDDLTPSGDPLYGGFSNDIAYNQIGYQGEGAFDLGAASFHNNTSLGIDVGYDAAVTPSGTASEVGMAVIDQVTLNHDGTLTITGWAPVAGAVISFGSTSATSTGYGQAQVFFSIFNHNGNVSDSPTGFFPTEVEGRLVAYASTPAWPFHFVIPANGIQVGDGITAVAFDLNTARIGEFSPTAIVSDGSSSGSGGQILTGGAARIVLPDSTTTSTQGLLDYRDGYFIDPDSKNWDVEVRYGDDNPAHPIWHSVNYSALNIGAPSNSEGLSPAITEYGFTLHHQYQVAGTYTVAVVVTDLNGNASSRTMTVSVANQAPVIDLTKTVPPTPVMEGHVMTLTGQVSDPNPGDTVTVEVNWDDGSGYTTSGVSLIGSRFTATHIYSIAGTYDISIRATDSQGKQTILKLAMRPGIVLQAPPSNLQLNLENDTVYEGDTVRLPITFYSPAASESDKLDIDWGDNSGIQTIPFTVDDAGYFSLSEELVPSHQYINTSGNPEHPDQHRIKVTLTTGHNGNPSNAFLTVTEAIQVIPVPITVDVDSDFEPEGSESTFDVSFNDPGWSGEHTLTIDWADGSPVALSISLGTDTAISLSHVYVEGDYLYAPTFTVTRSIDITTDPNSGDGAESNAIPARSGQTTVEGYVANIAPFFVNSDLPTPTPKGDESEPQALAEEAGSSFLVFTDVNGQPLVGNVSEGDTVMATGTVSDPGTQDAPAVIINWGDGTTSQASVYADGTFKAIHKYVNDALHVTATVTDKHGDSTVVSQDFTVLNQAPVIKQVVIVSAGSNDIFTVKASDPGSQDPLTFQWILDGQVLATDGPGPSRSDTRSIPFGQHVLQVQVSDDQGAMVAFSTLIISGDGTLAPTDADVATAAAIANVTITSVTLIAGDQNGDVLDARGLSAQYPTYLIGGIGDDTMYGGHGFTTVYAPHNDTINTERSGARIQVDSHSSATIQASLGNNNALDFSLNSFGVNFDLSQVGTTLAQSAKQDIASSSADAAPNEHFVQAAGRFSELDGSSFADRLTGSSGATLIGGAGNDTYLAPSGVTNGLSVLETGNDNNEQNLVELNQGTTVNGLNVTTSDGAGITVENSGFLSALGSSAAANLFQDGTGSGAGTFSFTNMSTGTIVGTTNVAASGLVGINFTNNGTMSAGLTGPVLSFKGDGAGSGGGLFSFTNASVGRITGTTTVSTSGNSVVSFTNNGVMSGASTGPVLSFNGDGAGSGGGIFSFTNATTGTIFGTTVASTSGNVTVSFMNSGLMTGGSSAPALSFKGDGGGSGGGVFSFTNATTGTIFGTTVASTSGNAAVSFTNSGTMSAGSFGPVLSFKGDGTGAGGGAFSFTNTSTGTIYGTTVASTSGNVAVSLTNNGVMSAGSSAPALSFRGDGTGSGGGTFSFTNAQTGSIYGSTVASTSGNVMVSFTNSGSMVATSFGPALSFRGDGTGSGGGIFTFTNASTGSISGTTSFATSGNTGVIFTNQGTLSGGSFAPALSYQGDGTGSGGGVFSFTNASTGTIAGTTTIATSGSTGVIFTNQGSMSGSSFGPALSYKGDGTGSGAGIFSFTNASTGTISGSTVVATSGIVGVIFTNRGAMSGGSTSGGSMGPVLSFNGDGTGSGAGVFSFTNTSTGSITGTTVVSTSGSVGVILTNRGSMSAGSTGPVISFNGDGTGSGAGIFSFTNASTGTISGTMVVSTSGKVGVIFNNSGSMSAGSTGPALSFQGDGTGSGGGIFSFTNASTGTISGTTNVSTSGSVGVIFRNYGSMSGASVGPALSMTGDGQGSTDGGIAFYNAAGATIQGSLDINTAGGTSLAFQNDGAISETGEDSLSLSVSDAGQLQAANLGTIQGQWDVSGGQSDDLLYQASTASADQIHFIGGGGSNTFLNEGFATTITFDATASDQSADLNLLENTHAANDNNEAGPDPTIQMYGGSGPNALINLADGTGYSLTFYGGPGPDNLFNAAPRLPDIHFYSGGSADRGNWSFALGDVLQNVGDNVQTIEYSAGNDDSPDLLLNSGDNVRSITMNGNGGYNLLENAGAGVSNISLEGSAPEGGSAFAASRILDSPTPDDGHLPEQANSVINLGSNVTGIVLHGGVGDTSFYNSGANVTGVTVIAGNNGGASFYNAVSGVNLSNVGFRGGDSSDIFRNDATGLSHFDLDTGGGGDVVDLRGGSTGSYPNRSTIELGDGGATFVSSGADLANVTIYGGNGDDRFELLGSSASDVSIFGGLGSDLFVAASDGAQVVSFTGAGAVTAVNFGRYVGSLSVYGGDGDASFYNFGDNANSIQLTGGSGSNLLENLARSVNDLTMIGGSGPNRLYSARSSMSVVDLIGGEGTNDLDLEGGDVQSVSFLGGDGNDAARISATVLNYFAFNGGGGNNSLELAGDMTSPYLSSSIVLGTNGNNVVILDGSLGSSAVPLGSPAVPLTVQGGSGNDRYVVTPTLTGNVILTGGHGNNTYVLSEAAAAVTVNQTWLGDGDTSVDTLDFSSFHQAGINFDLSSVEPQQEGPLTLQLTDGTGISNVIGTPFVDTIIGNGRDNLLQGAAYSPSGDPSIPSVNTNVRTQWVYVDFDTFTLADHSFHVYMPEERQAIIDQINTYYRGSADLGSENPWYDVRVTQNPAQIPQNLRGSNLFNNQYITVFVNATPSNGQPGGESSEIDPGNRDLGGFAVVQVNGSLGGAFQPANTSDNFAKLTAKIAAHEIGHLLGMEHSDAIGPIGYGTHLPLYPGQPDPATFIAPAAFETTDNIISSPASVGSDRFSDLGSLYFGEREDIKLAIALADPGVVGTTKQSAPSTLEAPQQLDLVPLTVHNTLGADALNYGKQFIVSARQVDGHTGDGSSDFYRFYASTGQLLNAEAASVILASAGKSASFDSMLILRDDAGNVVDLNHDSFETTDAQIVDFLVTHSGYYTLEVAGENSAAGAYRLTVTTFEAISNPSLATGVDNLLGKAGVDRFNTGPGIDYGLSLSTGLGQGTSVAGDTFSRTVGYTDPGGFTWAATVDYGDGSAAVTLTQDQIDRLSKTLSLSHAYTHSGHYTVSITLTNDDGLTDTKTFSVDVSASVATHFGLSAPATDVAGTELIIVVTAFDAYNNVATGYAGTIQFTSSDGQAVLPGISTLKNGTGTFTATLKTAGNQTLTATDSLASSIGGSTIVKVSAASATHFAMTAPSTATAGTALQITMTALDAYNNSAIGYAGTVHFTSSDGKAVLPADSSLVNGVGTFSTTLGTAGNQTLTATDKVTSTINGSTSVSVSAGVATHYTVVGPATATAGTSFQFTVTALDAYNNTASAYAGTIHFTSSDGKAVLPADSTLVNGVGTFNATLGTAGNQTLTATDKATSTINGNTSVSVSAGVATHYTVSGPATATAGTSFQFTITALDANNNTVTGYGGAVHFTSSDGQAILPANSALVNGTGTFNATLKSAGSQTLIATDTSNSTITSTATVSVTGSVSVATHFSISVPATTVAGKSFSVTVTALDASNKVVTGYSGTVKFTSSDSQALLPANGTLTKGVGTFTVTLKTAGAQTLTATDTVTSSVNASASITVNVGSVTHFKNSISGPVNGLAGIAVSFTITALDDFNNVVKGYAGIVQFTSSDGQAILPTDARLTNGAGTFSATLKTSGTQTITATDSVAKSINCVATVNVLSGATTHFALSAPTTATAGTAFNYTITALDAYGNLVKGYNGTIHITSSDGQAILPADSKLTSGIGTFTVTLKTAGNQTLTGTDTASSSIKGSATVSVIASSATHFAMMVPANAVAGTSFNVAITALDAYNNVVTGYAGTIMLTSSDSQAVLPSTVNFKNGVATFTATLKSLGNQTLTATDKLNSSLKGTSSAIKVTST